MFPSVTATSVTISWTQRVQVYEYKVELRRVTDARQFCPTKIDYKSKIVNSSVPTHFSNLYEFSIYNVAFMTTSTGPNATIEFTTKAAGTDIMILYYVMHYAKGLFCCSTYCSPTHHKHFVYHLQKC